MVCARTRVNRGALYFLCLTCLTQKSFAQGVEDYPDSALLGSVSAERHLGLSLGIEPRQSLLRAAVTGTWGPLLAVNGYFAKSLSLASVGVANPYEFEMDAGTMIHVADDWMMALSLGAYQSQAAQLRPLAIVAVTIPVGWLESQVRLGTSLAPTKPMALAELQLVRAFSSGRVRGLVGALFTNHWLGATSNSQIFFMTGFRI
jgi:hypothetical protein